MSEPKTVLTGTDIRRFAAIKRREGHKAGNRKCRELAGRELAADEWAAVNAEMARQMAVAAGRLHICSRGELGASHAERMRTVLFNAMLPSLSGWRRKHTAIVCRRNLAALEAERAAADLRRKEADRLRRRVFAALRKLGFRREYTSGRSAYYYHLRAGLTVRVSDHDVPMTAEREHNLANGGRSWANSRFSIVLGDECEKEWLEEVATIVAERTEIYAE